MSIAQVMLAQLMARLQRRPNRTRAEMRELERLMAEARQRANRVKTIKRVR